MIRRARLLGWLAAVGVTMYASGMAGCELAQGQPFVAWGVLAVAGGVWILRKLWEGDRE